MFKLYDCKLRLNGSAANELRKSGVTAPEIEILRMLHGADAVVEIVEVGEEKRTSRQERERLHSVYAPPSALGEPRNKRLAQIREIFGHERLELPKDLAESAHGVEVVDEDEAPAPSPVKTARRSAAVREPAFAA